jgi:hypothetical protein
MRPEEKEWWRKKNHADYEAAKGRWHQEQMSRINKESRTGGSCFIATAAFGDYSAPEVVFLSTFRDESLSQSVFGRSFIRAYYVISPSFAAIIVKSNFLRLVVRKLLQPTIFLLKKGRSAGL